MDFMMRALAQNIDQSLYTARELKLETVEQLLLMASLELSMRQQIIDSAPQPRPQRNT
ncbi:hypothetical protein [Pseudolabrys sp. FHR47]|uniref:hypothetical protein n=1 Tax=Pseudolabrys sp. FHR47 TaxID=2562284 RepID=UPI00143D24B6|nr:hypothetical protein [Pseudolabrys sp. FHR47]